MTGAFAHKLAPLQRTTFSAYQLSDPAVALDSGAAHHKGDFDTLEDAQQACSLQHKQRIMIRERDEFTGKAVLHFYQVRQSGETWVRKPGFAHAMKQKRLTIEHLFDLNAGEVL